MLVRMANGEDPDQDLHSLSRPFWQATSVRNFRIFTVNEDRVFSSLHALRKYQI